MYILLWLASSLELLSHCKPVQRPDTNWSISKSACIFVYIFNDIYMKTSSLLNSIFSSAYSPPVVTIFCDIKLLLLKIIKSQARLIPGVIPLTLIELHQRTDSAKLSLQMLKLRYKALSMEAALVGNQWREVIFKWLFFLFLRLNSMQNIFQNILGGIS